MLCAVPAIRALRAAYPDAEITLLGLSWADAFVKRFNCYIDRFIHFPGYSGLPEQEYDAVKFAAFLLKIRNEKFDLIIQMQGNGTIVNELISYFNAKYIAGFQNAESLMNSNLFLEYPEQDNEIIKHIKLVEFLGIEAKGSNLEFFINENDQFDLNKVYLFFPQKEYICFHPGSKGKWRQWPPKYFAALADICIEKGFLVVITGVENEREITSEMIKYMHHTAIDLTGATTLGAAAVLIKNAFLLIANCTGVSHIAAAVETPSIIISMDGEPHRWSPLNKNLHTVIDFTTNKSFEKVLAQTMKRLEKRSLAADEFGG